MPTGGRASTPEPRLLWGNPLGVVFELLLMSIIAHCAYMSLFLSSKFFRHFRLAAVRYRLSDLLPPGATPAGQCPAGYSEWVDYPYLGCKADAAIAIEVATPVAWTLLGAGVAGVGLVIIRKARDAGVTLSLPWTPGENRDDDEGHTTRYDRYRGTPGPRPPGPPPVRPQHQRILWYLEPALTLMAMLSLLVFFRVVWKLLTHPGYTDGYDMPQCRPGPLSTPSWVYEYSHKSATCVDSWRLVLLGAVYALNSLCAAALNGLAVVLVRRELLHDGWDWL